MPLSPFNPMDHIVGVYKIVKTKKESNVLTPIYKDRNEVIILKIKYKDDIKDIINKYFFNYLKNVYFYSSNKVKARDFKHLSMIDEGTGLFNQRKLSLDLEEAIKIHKNRKTTFNVMFIDIDYFKTVNDHWGHVVGSQMLIQIGTLLRKNITYLVIRSIVMVVMNLLL
jgi:GGDEF domain-containing protein